jgi:hypothetical protein
MLVHCCDCIVLYLLISLLFSVCVYLDFKVHRFFVFYQLPDYAIVCVK